MHFFSFNIGDYYKKTGHLTETEDLAYRRLLDLYYDEEKPLENEPVKLARRIRMADRPEIISAILAEFFTLQADGFWHKNRCDEAIASYRAISEGGKKGAEARKLKGGYGKPKTPVDGGAIGGGNGGAIEPPMPTINHNQKPETIKEDREDTRATLSPLEIGMDFEKFWSAYPKKEGRKAAFTAYEQARGEGIDHARIIEGVDRYAAFAHGTKERFLIPPYRWLRDGHWDDVHPAKPAAGKSNGKPAYADSIKSAGEFAIRNINEQEQIRQKARQG